MQAQKHNAPLVALDFSEDSNYVQSASEDNELLYRESPVGCECSHFVFHSWIIGNNELFRDKWLQLLVGLVPREMNRPL